MIKKILKINQKKLFVFTAALSLLLALTYIYGVNATIINTSKRSQIEKHAEQLRYKIGELEFDLIAKRNNISIELAYSIGFSETENITYISKKPVAAVVGTLNIQ